MLVTTTDSLEGHRVREYLGVVSGEAILGANMFRDFFASIRDVVGGRSAGYEKELRRAKAVAMNEMIEQARELGATAIVGVDLDYEALGSRCSWWSPTAPRCAPKSSGAERRAASWVGLPHPPYERGPRAASRLR
jgi:uncharacterized protein YbjQ (UPF0145 family)